MALVFCFISIILIGGQTNENTQMTEKRPEWFELAYSQFGAYGQQSALAVFVRAPQNISANKLDVEIYEHPPASEFVYVDGPWISASENLEFRKKIREEAEKYGWNFLYKNYTEISPSNKARILFLPSGAWPTDFDIDTQLTKKDCLLFLGLQKNISLQKNGAVVEGGAPVWSFAQQNDGDTQFHKAQIENRTLFIKQSTFDEAAYKKDFDKDLIKFAWEECSEPKIKRTLEYAQDAKLISFEKELNISHVRISLRSDGQILRVWRENPIIPTGSVESETEILNTGKTAFRAQITQNINDGQRIEYAAVIIDSQNNVYDKIPLANISAQQASMQKRRVFVDTFFISDWPKTEFAKVEIQDQYGRIYARTFVRLPDYRIEKIGAVGIKREFEILKNSNPPKDQYIFIRKNESARWTKVALRDAKFSVGSKWENGENNLQIRIGSKIIDYSWEDQRVDFTSKMVSSLIWILPIFAIIYVAMNSAQREKYKIIFEQMPNVHRESIEITKKELLKMLQKPKTVDEITTQISRANKSANTLSPQSVKDALDFLVTKNELVNHLDYYANKKRIPRQKLVEMSIEKTIKDRLLERGISSKKKQRMIIDSAKRRWVVVSKDKPEKIRLDKIIGADFVVFENLKEKKEFEKHIQKIKNEDSAKILLSIELGKLRFLSLQQVWKFAKYD